jgi:uncharacterized phage infection (PIP) family protein YhgE
LADEELENQLATLKTKITLLESQLQQERLRTRSVQEERDEAIKALAAALNESEGIKSENKVLKQQIASLRQQFEGNLKGTAQVTAKARVIERVESERRKVGVHKRHVEREPERNVAKSFIEVDGGKSILT